MDMKTSPLSTLVDPGLLKTDGLINGEWTAGQAGGRRNLPRSDTPPVFDCPKTAEVAHTSAS